MDKVVLCLGIVILLLGIVYLIRPDVIRWLLGFFKQGSRLYLVALVRFALAVVFLLGARECGSTWWVILIFGVLFLISGLLIVGLGLKRVKSILDWWEKQSSVLLRILALVSIAVGGVIVYSAW
ncbi:MAG: hypothetical protein ACYSTF_09650 [Planctomycetota bacterium]|jgi:hypothetical protein